MDTASDRAAAEEPRWLTDEEQRVWRAYLHATTLLEDHLDRQLQRDAGHAAHLLRPARPARPTPRAGGCG